MTLDMSDTRYRWWIALWISAIAIRLIVLPFTLHMDAYQIYSRASEAAYEGEWFSWTAQIVVQSVHNVWLLVIRPLLPDSAAIWSDTASVAGVGASPEDYQRFLDYQHVHRAIALMKLPYIAADLACAVLIGRLVKPKRRLAATAIWLLNPLVIYSTALYGRHDVIAILLVLGSYAIARRGTDIARLGGLLMLGVAALMRFFPVVLAPLFLLAYKRTNRQLAGATFVLVGMWMLVEIVALSATGESPTLEILSTHVHVEYWTDAQLRLRFDDFIFLFPTFYLIALLWLGERGVQADEYATLGAMAFLLLFALTFFHPHWAIWLVPFLALTIAGSPRLIAYHALQVIALGVYMTQWGSWTTWELLRPTIGDRVASLPDPYEAVNARIEPRLFYGLSRSALTAISLWMIWSLLRPLWRRHAHE